MSTPTTTPQRGLLFKAAMVLAQLDGRKTQTRRLMNPQPSEDWQPHSYGEVHRIVDGEPDPEQIIGWGPCNESGDEAHVSKYGQPGGEFYVKETHGWADQLVDGVNREEPVCVAYRAGGAIIRHEHENIVDLSDPAWNLAKLKWRPSIFMPAWAARIRNRLTAVRAERLQTISEEDAKAEGCAPAFSHRVYPSKHAAKVKLYREGYRLLWNSISLKPKPVYDTIDGQRKIVRYASFPWSLEDFYAAYPDQREAIEDRAMFTWRGNPLTVTPNPFVWVLTFQRLLP